MEEKEHKDFYTGSDIGKITMIKTVQGIIIDLFNCYPAYESWGIIEGRFWDKKLGEKVRDKLEKDGIIDVRDIKVNEEIVKGYGLTSKGINFAISLSQLEYAEEMRKFTITIIVLGTLTFLIGLNQLILTYLQNPIF